MGFTKQFVAVKIHLGEPETWPSRPNLPVVAGYDQRAGRKPFLTDCNRFMRKRKCSTSRFSLRTAKLFWQVSDNSRVEGD